MPTATRVVQHPPDHHVGIGGQRLNEQLGQVAGLHFLVAGRIGGVIAVPAGFGDEYRLVVQPVGGQLGPQIFRFLQQSHAAIGDAGRQPVVGKGRIGVEIEDVEVIAAPGRQHVIQKGADENSCLLLKPIISQPAQQNLRVRVLALDDGIDRRQHRGVLGWVLAPAAVGGIDAAVRLVVDLPIVYDRRTRRVIDAVAVIALDQRGHEFHKIGQIFRVKRSIRFVGIDDGPFRRRLDRADDPQPAGRFGARRKDLIRVRPIELRYRYVFRLNQGPLDGHAQPSGPACH